MINEGIPNNNFLKILMLSVLKSMFISPNTYMLINSLSDKIKNIVNVLYIALISLILIKVIINISKIIFIIICTPNDIGNSLTQKAFIDIHIPDKKYFQIDIFFLQIII